MLTWERMNAFRGHDRGSVLIGTSTRNQRIERLWRDVFRCFGNVFYYTFKSMEEGDVVFFEAKICLTLSLTFILQCKSFIIPIKILWIFPLVNIIQQQKIILIDDFLAKT